MTAWAQNQIADLLGISKIEITLQDLSGDAGFRHYYRTELSGTSFIVVDSPAETEDNEAFVRITDTFRQAGMITPQVLRVDYQRGFMLQEDFGDRLYLQALQASCNAPDEIDRLYKLAIDALVTLQKNADVHEFSAFDRELLHEEMALFQSWFCEKYLELTLSKSESELIAESFHFLEDQALNQRQVVVHRDYHSRNLMIPDSERYGDDHIPAVIDFQDAVTGPYTYDLVSLLRDCYISWPLSYVRNLGLYYRRCAEREGVISDIDEAEFFRNFDLMGLQRNLKVMGIFARLSIRDNKPQYLADIPQTIRYFTEVAPQYPELATFLDWFTQKILPMAIHALPSGELCER
ncbi:MAG: phosphotransferase [Gammaproteobacteria bacterium]|nr:phosphotransferase [Gammaproteobacteria bacterium]